MKAMQIVILVVGASLVTFVVSVIFSINMVSISPKNLAKVIKEDPEAIMMALKEASENYQKQAKQKALEEQFKNPHEIATEGRVTFGNAEAPVTIVEFSDFQCPYCSMAATRMKATIKKYEGKVNLVYKHFPLSFHPFAKPAAEYFEALALISQDKAKEFHDAIFDNFKDYARLKDEKAIEKSLKALLKKVGVTFAEVEKNMEPAKEVVKADMAEAMKLNVRGTPSFFVNGVQAQGSVEELIDRFLEEM